MFMFLWLGTSLGNFSLKAAWNLLRSSTAEVKWASLIWNIFVSPCLACFSWRLLHRKTPTDCWMEFKGIQLASRCYSCFRVEESDVHLFFEYLLAQQLWSWLLSLMGLSLSSPLFPSVIWVAIAHDGNVPRRKIAVVIFFHAISVLWFLRNESKHSNRKPSMPRVKIIFLDRMKGLASSMLVQSLPRQVHHILVQLRVLT